MTHIIAEKALEASPLTRAMLAQPSIKVAVNVVLAIDLRVSFPGISASGERI